MFGKDVFLLVISTTIAQSLNFAVTPALTRIYSANALGHLQIYASLMAFVMVIIALRYELAVVLPQDNQVAANLAAVAFTAVLGMVGVLALGVYFITRHQLVWRAAEQLGVLLWLLPIGAFGAGVYQVFLYWGLRHNAYKDIAVSKFSQVGTQAAIQLGAGLLSHGALIGLVAGDACGRISGSYRIAKTILKHDRTLLWRVRPRTMWEAARRYRNFPLVLSWAGLINSAGLQVVVVVLSAYYGAGMVGLYAVTDRTLQVPSALVAQGMSQVYMSRAAQLRTSDPAGLQRLFSKIVTRSLLYGTSPVVLICAFAPSVFAFVFGEPWRTSGYYARILAPLYLLAFTHQCVGITLNTLERQTWQAAWDTLRLIAVTAVLVVGARAGLNFTYELSAFVGVSCLAYLLHIALCYSAINQAITQ
jgi:O-antigen/teichoic acid export membrane protein